MTDTSALRAFIDARLNEDAAIAHGAHGQGEWNEGSAWLADMVHPLQSQLMERPGWIPMVTVGDIRHIARHDPARVSREIAAKRAILAEHTSGDTAEFEGRTSTIAYCPICSDSDCLTLRALASVWSDHADYRTEWSTT